MVYVIQKFSVRAFRFDPTWDNATTAGLACLEADLATVCAALPVFWPVLTTTWGRIFVTTEVSVTREVGPFHPRKHLVKAKGELRSTSSHQNLTTITTSESSSQGGSGPPDGWEPFVGDETTGLGENETMVEAPRGEKLSGGFIEANWLRRRSK